VFIGVDLLLFGRLNTRLVDITVGVDCVRGCNENFMYTLGMLQIQPDR